MSELESSGKCEDRIEWKSPPIKWSKDGSLRFINELSVMTHTSSASDYYHYIILLGLKYLGPERCNNLLQCYVQILPKKGAPKAVQFKSNWVLEPTPMSSNLTKVENEDNRRIEVNGKWTRVTEFKDISPSSISITHDVCVRCEISYEKPSEAKSEDVDQEHESINISTIELLSVYESLLNNERFADIIISVEQKEIHAHKLILASRSTIFEAALKPGTTECKDGKICIEDTSYDAMYEVLRFIYTGKVKNLSADDNMLALELCAAADKYDLSGLTRICEEYLLANIKEDNVLDILIIADRHRISRLKNEAICYILDHPSSMVDKPEFMKLPYSLMAEILSQSLSALARF